MVGVVPTSVLRSLGEFSARNDKMAPLLGPLFGSAFGQTRPLTEIDGIDIYERERVALAGITDVEAMAHADLVASMINARIPMERLVDWADQAVLILHVEGGATNRDVAGERMVLLRGNGVRTASAFIRITKSRGGPKTLATILKLGDDDLEPRELAGVMNEEPIMRYVDQWRESPLGHPHPVNPEVGRTTGNGTGTPGQLSPDPVVGG